MAALTGPRRGRLAVGDTLLPSSFPQVGAPGVVAWNQGTTAAVVFAPHLGDCPSCSRYLTQLGEAVEGLRDWATRVMVLASDPDSARQDPALTEAARCGVVVLADAEGTGRDRLGAGADHAVVVQADRYGAVFEAETVASVDADHGSLPSASALVSLAQYIDMQCPECGIPSREWLSATPFPLG